MAKRLWKRYVWAAAVLSLCSVHHALLVSAQDRVPVGPAAVEGPPAPKIPTHFILNPDVSRPAGYPAKISLKEAEAFAKTQKIQGQGCGGMSWEGSFCGMFHNTYGTVETPWVEEQAEFDATFAQTKTGNFLTGVSIGHNNYTRADRTIDKLTWNANRRHVHERSEIHEVLVGGNSEKRKQLLAQVAASFEKLDLKIFPAKERESLRTQIARCESDSDREVAALARQLAKQLSKSLRP
jgi:hypothetical protein